MLKSTDLGPGLSEFDPAVVLQAVAPEDFDTSPDLPSRERARARTHRRTSIDTATVAPFESLFGQIAHDFARVNEITDSAIELAHVRLCQGLGLNACAILRRLNPGEDLTQTFSWTSKGDAAGFAPVRDFPSALSQPPSGRPIVLSDGGGETVVIYPLMLGKSILGASAFLADSGAFDDSLETRLRAVIDFLENVLVRAEVQKESARLQCDLQRLREQAESDCLSPPRDIKINGRYENIIGKSAATARVIAQAEQVAATESIVLLSGETGTGKELFAQLIHDLSPRRAKHMVKVNCAALPPGLVESELFGRERGAYTGALTREIGRFELAHQSTIFLDELGELPIELQSKLLRVLQDGCFERVGNPKSIRVNVRVIAATNRDLKAEVAAGRFREDLYYRLNVFPIEIPPLRERPEDIPMLAWAFAAEFGRAMNKTIETIPQSAMEALQRYPWPGNIRELRNIIERGVIVTTGPALKVVLPQGPASPSVRTAPTNLQELERQHILEVLRQSRWRVRGAAGAAEMLGLKPTTLEARMAKLGISRTSARQAP
jgi:formate hydrogenlyase transcriptional activator